MKLKGHFERLNKLHQEYNYFETSLIATNCFKPTVIAAFVKSLEFNLFLQRNRSKTKSFSYSPFHEKFLWLKKEYEDLIILEAEKPTIFELGHNHDGNNIQYSYTDKMNNKKSSS